MTQTKSPVALAREAKGLNRSELAAAIGYSYSSVANAELGNLAGIPASWTPGLAAVGIDRDELNAAYLAWRSAMATAAAGKAGA